MKNVRVAIKKIYAYIETFFGCLWNYFSVICRIEKQDLSRVCNFLQEKTCPYLASFQMQNKTEKFLPNPLKFLPNYGKIEYVENTHTS